jgi:hypothetical protein
MLKLRFETQIGGPVHYQREDRHISWMTVGKPKRLSDKQSSLTTAVDGMDAVCKGEAGDRNESEEKRRSSLLVRNERGVQCPSSGLAWCSWSRPRLNGDFLVHLMKLSTDGLLGQGRFSANEARRRPSSFRRTAVSRSLARNRKHCCDAGVWA